MALHKPWKKMQNFKKKKIVEEKSIDISQEILRIITEEGSKKFSIKSIPKKTTEKFQKGFVGEIFKKKSRTNNTKIDFDLVEILRKGRIPKKFLKRISK